jgi:hypothetical protein
MLKPRRGIHELPGKGLCLSESSCWLGSRTVCMDRLFLLASAIHYICLQILESVSSATFSLYQLQPFISACQLSQCPHFHSLYSLGRAPRPRLPCWWPWNKARALHSIRRRQACEGPHRGNVQVARKGFTWRDKRRFKIITCLHSLLAVSSFLCLLQRDWVSFTPSPAPTWLPSRVSTPYVNEASTVHTFQHYGVRLRH